MAEVAALDGPESGASVGSLPASGGVPPAGEGEDDGTGVAAGALVVDPAAAQPQGSKMLSLTPPQSASERRPDRPRKDTKPHSYS